MRRDFAEMLLAAAAELNELSVLADSISAGDLDIVLRLQPLDRMSQHLAALATFLATAAAALPSGGPDLSAALARMPVSDLADRLGGHARLACVTSGSLELF